MEQEGKMEVLTGKIVEKGGAEAIETAKEVELFTNPVAVHRVRLSFGAVPVVQLVLTAVCGAALWYLQNSGGEAGKLAEEIARRLAGG